MKKTAIIIISLILLSVSVQAKEIKIGFNYNRFFLDTKVDGFKFYMGDSADNCTTLVATIPKAQMVVSNEKPFLLKERFDTDPGTKYNITRGSWSWVEKTKNMKIESDEFMVVFEYPANDTNAMNFFFWPEKKLGDQAQLYVYLKDEAASTDGGVYYELRFGAASGTRYSNWRKVYDKNYGGVDPNGAFPLPRFDECDLQPEGETICPGNLISMTWEPGVYCAEVLNKTMCGNDDRPLNINKLEIIIKQQSGWIDDIIIGGQLELTTPVINVDTSQDKVYFAATSYNSNGESDKSIPVLYETVVDFTKMTPKKPSQFRKLPNATQTN